VLTYTEFVELVSGALSELATATRVHTDSDMPSIETTYLADSYGVRFYVRDEHSTPDNLVGRIHAALMRLRGDLISNAGNLYWKIYTRGSGHTVEVIIILK